MTEDSDHTAPATSTPVLSLPNQPRPTPEADATTSSPGPSGQQADPAHPPSPQQPIAYALRTPGSTSSFATASDGPGTPNLAPAATANQSGSGSRAGSVSAPQPSSSPADMGSGLEGRAGAQTQGLGLDYEEEGAGTETPLGRPAVGSSSGRTVPMEVDDFGPPQVQAPQSFLDTTDLASPAQSAVDDRRSNSTPQPQATSTSGTGPPSLASAALERRSLSAGPEPIAPASTQHSSARQALGHVPSQSGVSSADYWSSAGNATAPNNVLAKTNTILSTHSSSTATAANPGPTIQISPLAQTQPSLAQNQAQQGQPSRSGTRRTQPSRRSTASEDDGPVDEVIASVPSATSPNTIFAIPGGNVSKSRTVRSSRSSLANGMDDGVPTVITGESGPLPPGAGGPQGGHIVGPRMMGVNGGAGPHQQPNFSSGPYMYGPSPMGMMPGGGVGVQPPRLSTSMAMGPPSHMIPDSTMVPSPTGYMPPSPHIGMGGMSLAMAMGQDGRYPSPVGSRSSMMALGGVNGLPMAMNGGQGPGSPRHSAAPQILGSHQRAPSGPSASGQSPQTPIQQSSGSSAGPLPISLPPNGPQMSPRASSGMNLSMAMGNGGMGLMGMGVGVNMLPTGPAPTFAPIIGPGGEAKEVCVECMMRDRDMADVDVTGPGVWARASDADWEEAVRAAEMEDLSLSEDHGPGTGGTKEHANGSGSLRRASGNVTEESLPASKGRRRSNVDTAEASTAPSKDSAHRGRKRVTQGHPLTQSSLKLWTSLNPPASSHRWRTLQVFLADQADNLNLEFDAHARNQRERDQAEQRARDRHSQDVSVVSAGRSSRRSEKERERDRSSRLSFSRNRASKVLPNGMILENVDVTKDERRAKELAKKARRRASSVGRPRGASEAGSRPESPTMNDGASMNYLDHPWQPPRRFSSPIPPKRSVSGPAVPGSGNLIGPGSLNPQFVRSSGDVASMRSRSPSRLSVAQSERPFSFWGRGNRGASQSMLSLAPSGSMMDMHIGLEMDNRPMPQSPSMIMPPRPKSAGSVEIDKKKKKKGLRGIFSIFGKKSGGKAGAAREARQGASESFDKDLYGQGGYQDGEDELAPPPPLSVLVDNRRFSGRGSKSASTLSLASPSLNTGSNITNSHGFNSSNPTTAQSSLSVSGQLPLPSPASPGANSSYNGFASPHHRVPGQGDSPPRSPQNAASPRTSTSPRSSRAGLRPPYPPPDLDTSFQTAAESTPTRPSSVASAARREKSLPDLPPGDLPPDSNGYYAVHPGYQESGVNLAFPGGRPPPRLGDSRSAYSIRRSSTPDLEALNVNVSDAELGLGMSTGMSGSTTDLEGTGGTNGRKAKARSKVLSMHLFGLKKGDKDDQLAQQQTQQHQQHPDLTGGATCAPANPSLLSAVSRDQAFVALKYT